MKTPEGGQEAPKGRPRRDLQEKVAREVMDNLPALSKIMALTGGGIKFTIGGDLVVEISSETMELMAKGSEGDLRFNPRRVDFFPLNEDQAKRAPWL